MFHTPNFAFPLAVRHVSHPETCPIARRYLPNGGSVRHLSPLDTCLMARAPLILGAAMA